ncbi:hypothetical protein PHYSODRAFT_304926 [Phytophthora sojae]|uniref:ABC transmembrane type-1 domain-containing protein n=1 Tax=Phytophthora sojae (strain P6497) TaxID=1094619 RepID=G5A125_PHYSP|nr:hypothetical protein PHYSODRAFT_304926 [Phytophthora sojae]EGZ11457.1 hypothetical protein PHYSODRAFT_304926 [Phytophthora sojae]|eukprot:XP_009534202.1 hypothetical protein PHYSODRAFT_304926 [Phytophthora sojae]
MTMHSALSRSTKIKQPRFLKLNDDVDETKQKLHDASPSTPGAASFLSRLFVNPIMNTGNLRQLNFEDLWELDGEIRSAAALQDVWLGVFFASRFVDAILSTQMNYALELIALRLTVTLKTLLFQKAMRRSLQTKNDPDAVDISNLLTSDVNNVLWAAFQVNKLWIIPTQIVVAVWMLYVVIDLAAIAGLAVIALLMLISYFLAKLSGAAFVDVMKSKDDRLGVIKEVFNAVQIVKLNAWEGKFTEKIRPARTIELRLCSDISILVPSILLSSGHRHWQSRPYHSQFIQMFIQAKISISRFADYLLLDEFNPTNVTRDDPAQPDDVVMAIEDGTFGWTKEAALLNHVNLTVKQGDLVIVHGSVGSGKSSLCSALLGEMNKLAGNVFSQIFGDCICNLLADKTVVLVTHSADIIASEAANVEVLVESGKLKATRHDVALPRCSYTLPVSPRSVKDDASHDGESNANKDKDAGRLIDDEEREEGRVSKEVFSSYFDSLGGVKVCVFLFAVQTLWQVFQIGSDLWLSHWTGQKNGSYNPDDTVYNVKVYAWLGAGTAIMVLVRAATVAVVGLRASRQLFDNMTVSLLRAPHRFFDANPIGRIVNRYGDDMSAVDFMISFAFQEFLGLLFFAACQLATAVYMINFLGALVIPLVWIYMRIGNHYMAPSRETARLWKISASPILSYVSQSGDGIAVVRAFGQETVERMEAENFRRNDVNSKAWLAQMVFKH